MALTQITAATPSVIPATSEITYDKMWMTNLRVMAQSTTEDAVLVASFKPSRVVNGVHELMPDAEAVTVRVDGLFAYAANNSSFATTVNNVVEAVRAIGVEQGVFSA